MKSAYLLWLASVSAVGLGSCAEHSGMPPVASLPAAHDVVGATERKPESATSEFGARDLLFSGGMGGGGAGGRGGRGGPVFGLLAGAPAPGSVTASGRVPAAPQATPAANTLTAGSLSDNADWSWYLKFVKDQADKEKDNAPFLTQFTGRHVSLQLVDGNRRPIPDAVVTLAAADPPVSVRTRADGSAVFFAGWDKLPPGDTARLLIKAPSSETAVEALVPFDTPSPYAVSMDSIYDGGRLPRKLDLVFVIDCTGSMQDELDYLKVEVKSIAQGIKEKFPNVDERFGLICYRDKGDDFVVRKFDLTASLDEFSKNLSAQDAGGGGDEPESMQDALAAAAALEWGGDNVARVTFVIGDAPPHWPDMPAAMNAANLLRARGVAVYPVACSGASPDCEFIARTLALSTSASYLFATDHSGVGNAHAEPHFPTYNVEKLAPLMTRMIAGELSGHPVDPTKEEIIATVETVKTPSTAPVEKN